MKTFLGNTELPYSYKCRNNRIFRILNIVRYDIYFEDTAIRFNFTYADAKELVQLLNTAWTLGYGSGHISGYIKGQNENSNHSNN